MNIMDILGPVMIGPSSSHTAGAVRLGLLARHILGAPVVKADIILHGSFAETYKGHGTDIALLAGLMNWQPDDGRIPDAKQYAERQGLEYHFSKENLGTAVHPNTVMFTLQAQDGSYAEITGSSIGGGQVVITGIDGMEVEYTGRMPALIINNMDEPGVLNHVTELLAAKDINIATMKLFRDEKGGIASILIECDQPLPEEIAADIRGLSGIISVCPLPKIL